MVSVRKILLAVGLFGGGLSSAGLAQMQQPPRHDSQSPTGVSYRSLSFSLQETDLSIGGADGLTLERSYNSNLADSANLYAQTVGWVHNFHSSIRIETISEHPDFDTGWQVHLYQIAVGPKSYGFYAGGTYPIGGPGGGHPGPPLNPPSGPVDPISKSGARLYFNGTTWSGYFTLVDGDGSVINFTPGLSYARVANITSPDGTRLDFTYSNGILKSVFSNRGYAILFDGTATACAINTAATYVTATSACPSGENAVTYGYTNATFRAGSKLLTSVTQDGETTTYGYAGADHLSCVKDPGQTQCRITNTYYACPPNLSDPNRAQAEYTRRYRDPVVSQQMATGETYVYSSTVTPCPPENNDTDYYAWTPNITTVTASDNSQTKVDVNVSGTTGAVTDPLDRTTVFHYENNVLLASEATEVAYATDPEDDYSAYLRDARGNIYQTDSVAKPGSGLAPIVTTASYPSTCSNAKICNQPTSVTDAKGNTTSYTYDSDHGGVRTVTSPAIGGVAPQKRYEYAERYAWMKNSGGTWTQSATPVWVKTKEEFCKTTAATSGGDCTGGASDEVITEYQYEQGSASKGSNLLLLGVTVTADGQTLRTCYGYDQRGRKISETQPKGTVGLTVCP